MLSHWRSPLKLEQLCKEPLPVVSQWRACWKHSPCLRQNVPFRQKHRWNARNARNSQERLDVSKWVTVHQSYAHFFEVSCALEMPCKVRVTPQSHRWHLAVGWEGSRGPGMQKVFETMSLNLNCFLQVFKWHRWHCNKVGWLGTAKKLPQRAEKTLPSLCSLFAASWENALTELC